MFAVAVTAPQLDQAIGAVEGVVATGLDAVSLSADAVELLRDAERLCRLAAVVRVDAISAVDAGGAHYEHGHTSAHHMARHLGKLSGAETARADKIRRMTNQCELIDAAWRNAELSVDQAAVLARAFANNRVRDHFINAQPWFLKLTSRPFKVFERRVADWVSRADQDGAEPKPDPAHEDRDVSLIQDHFSKQWNLKGTFGSLQGSKIRRILDAYISAENLTDWEIARDLHGAEACAEQLPRTDKQRRADALEQIFADALHNPDTSVPIETVHNIVWTQEAHEHEMRRFAGDTPEPVDIDDHRCHSLDGHSLHPASVFADFLTSKWRRVVQDAQGVTIDMSRKQRFFTGLARLGVQLSFDSCYWPGCHIAPTNCQIDHLTPWSPRKTREKPAPHGGVTDQLNGAPACQCHNRLKERGYTVVRLPDGSIQVTSPRGEILPE